MRAIGIGFLLWVSSSLAFGQRLTVLPVPDGYFSPTARYISRNGAVVVGSVRDRYNEYAVYWHNGRIAFVPNFVSGSAASAAKTVGGISADGSVIAVIGDPFGYLWNRTTGQFTEPSAAAALHQRGRTHRRWLDHRQFRLARVPLES
jgi:uncharacterized membrane protein